MKKTPFGKHKRKQGISLWTLTIGLGLIILAISILLLVISRFSLSGYEEMRKNTSDYVDWQNNAYDLQIGSDYLTEQVRYFAIMGDPVYLNNYFTEANETKRRDNAVSDLQRELAGTPAQTYLEAAMADSMELMEREYYSMRLTIEGFQYDISDFPEVIRDTGLTPEDEALSPEGKKHLALTMLVDKTYLEKKESITSNINLCLQDLFRETKDRESNTTHIMKLILQQELAFIIILILAVTVFVLCVFTLAIRPMRYASDYIKADQPIPLQGSREFRFLARTINLMREANIRKTGKLAFESTHDSLTGTYNRTGYNHLMEELDFSDTAFLIVDVDHFKQINDTFGHEAGDKSLSSVADALLHSFRPQDYICRIGGDEFVVIVQDVGPAQKDTLTHKINMINHQLTDRDQNEKTPSVSISVGGVFSEDLNDPAELFRRADEALYQVKENGRKGCAFYEG